MDSVQNYLWLKLWLEIQIWNWADMDSFKGSLNTQRKLCHFQPHYSVAKIASLYVLLKSHNAKINVLILSPSRGEKYINLFENIFTIKCSDKNYVRNPPNNTNMKKWFFPNKVMEPSYNRPAGTEVDSLQGGKSPPFRLLCQAIRRTVFRLPYLQWFLKLSLLRICTGPDRTQSAFPLL